MNGPGTESRMEASVARTRITLSDALVSRALYPVLSGTSDSGTKAENQQPAGLLLDLARYTSQIFDEAAKDCLSSVASDEQAQIGLERLARIVESAVIKDRESSANFGYHCLELEEIEAVRKSVGERREVWSKRLPLKPNQGGDDGAGCSGMTGGVSTEPPNIIESDEDRAQETVEAMSDGNGSTASPSGQQDDCSESSGEVLDDPDLEFENQRAEALREAIQVLSRHPSWLSTRAHMAREARGLRARSEQLMIEGLSVHEARAQTGVEAFDIQAGALVGLVCDRKSLNAYLFMLDEIKRVSLEHNTRRVYKYPKPEGIDPDFWAFTTANRPEIHESVYDPLGDEIISYDFDLRARVQYWAGEAYATAAASEATPAVADQRGPDVVNRGNIAQAAPTYSPKLMYHPTKPAMHVHSEAEEAALGPEWSRAYVHQSYPKVKYHWTGKNQAVTNEAEDLTLGGGWAETPAAFHPYQGTRPPRTEDQTPLKWVEQWSVPGLTPDHKRSIEAKLLRADAEFDKSPDPETGAVVAMRLAFDGIARVLFDARILNQDVLTKVIPVFVWESAIAAAWWIRASESRRDIFPEQVGRYWIWRDDNSEAKMVFAAEMKLWQAELLENPLDSNGNPPTKVSPVLQKPSSVGSPGGLGAAGQLDDDVRRALADAFKEYADRIHAHEWASYEDGETASFVSCFALSAREIVCLELAEDSDDDALLQRRVINRLKALCSRDPVPATWPWRSAELFDNRDFRNALWSLVKSETVHLRGGAVGVTEAEAFVAGDAQPNQETTVQPPSPAGEVTPDTSQKANAAILGEKRLVNFAIAELYLGITDRQRQRLMSKGHLKFEGQGLNRKITVKSLKKYLPPEYPT